MQQEIARESPSGKAELQVSSLHFASFPDQSRLFLDYIRDPELLLRFFPNAVASPKFVDRYVDTVLSSYQTDRAALCDTLSDINLRIDAGEKTLRNIDVLRQPDSVAVVTGQQAGLFTGPLYTIYKALSAIKMADELNSRGVKAVPVFWAATEDHDFDEVSHAFFLDAWRRSYRSEYKPDDYRPNVPVGSVQIDAGIERSIGDVFSNLQSTSFTAGVRDLLTASWREGELFGASFERTLATLLSRYGLVFIDPMDPRLKRLAAPVYERAIRHSDEIVASVAKRGRELVGQGYHEQVTIGNDYFPLFWHNESGQRVALRKIGDNRYQEKGQKREVSVSELIETAESNPETFSPGVMLRPVVQDYLLPTVCYFGGAAEIAYFAQNSEVYRILERPVTPIFHRQSFTIIEPKQRKMLDKFDVELPDLFAGFESMTLKIAEQSVGPDSGKLFTSVEKVINDEIDRLEVRLSKIDPTLAENLGKRRRKILYHIAALRKKTLLSEFRQHETINNQLQGLFASLLPNGGLQERSLNVFTYLNKYGYHFIDQVYGSIDLEDQGHRIIDL
ncbi:MAG: bacillithiol biosynthesis cysteine-adding enzyme BshC [Pyrinomonadaceae bacterium]